MQKILYEFCLSELIEGEVRIDLSAGSQNASVMEGF